ncbi:MAG: ATP-binding protein [Bacteroidota bacterium]
MSKQLLEQLKQVKDFGAIPEDQLEWIIDNSEVIQLKTGEFLFKRGDPMDWLFIILEGLFVLKLQQKNEFRVIGEIEAKTISGQLPYSRAASANGFAEATSECVVLALHRNHFKYMIQNNEELTTVLVHTMSSRIREFTKKMEQKDKMMALGKLSAGLAHELNNPSAAVVRSAQTLKKHLSSRPDNFKRVIKISMTDDEVDAINAILFGKLKNGIQHLKLMERTSEVDELAEWLEDRDFEDGYDIAENIVDYQVSVDDLDKISQCVSEQDLTPVINWINQVLITERLVEEIEDASQRINDLVMSIKSYTHMDRGSEKTFADIHIGINNTLTMLNHKLKKGQIEVEMDFDEELPQASIHVSALNQVWTNLIDNAIDALSDSDVKQLGIKSYQDGDFIRVLIKDSGKGISESIIDKIYDPFFTTKNIGEGTGLGLDVVKRIVHQHNGEIKVKSKPGNTEFDICIPIE